MMREQHDAESNYMGQSHKTCQEDPRHISPQL